MKPFFFTFILVILFQIFSYPYVFTWPHLDNTKDMKPVGGESRGSKVNLLKSPSKAWIKLQQTNLSKFEKDRLAILAMVGEYRVSFDFLETMGFTKNYSPSRPYQSWGTEFVTLIEDNHDFISLQHVMVLIVKKKDGSESEPMVIKHWRQDWHYEDKKILEYQGKNKWKKKTLKPRDRKGTWSQFVYNVDDSPRYQSYGTWTHNHALSSWSSQELWRELPRREINAGKNYDVLVGTHIKTITPTGWVHEQNNKKLLLASKENTNTLVLAKEIGIARYERIDDFNWISGKNYWNKTADFWKSTRSIWSDTLNNSDTLYFNQKKDGSILYQKLFKLAKRYENGDTAVVSEIQDHIEAHLN